MIRQKHNQIDRAQKKVMLHFLGVEFADIPGSMKEVNSLLEAWKRNYPAKYERCRSIIVDQNIPTGGLPEDDKKETGFKAIGELISDHLEPAEERYKKAASEIEKKFREDTAQVFVGIEQKALSIAMNAIEEASQKYHRIEIKVGDGKVIKMDDIVPDEFEKIIELAAQRVNIMLVGPAGCGKTHIAAQVAKALDIDYSSQSCSAGMSESQLTGWLLPIGDSGRFSYVSSEFIRIYENGGVFLFDEIDAADPNVMIFVNQALANGYFFLPQRFEKPRVDRHPDFVAIAAANTFGGGANAMYTARNALDAATLDRFKMGMIPMDYSPIVEERLVDPEVLAWGRHVREVIAKHKMRKLLSTRVMLDATKMKASGWDINKIMESYFADWTPEEKRVIKTEFGIMSRNQDVDHMGDLLRKVELVFEKVG